MERIIITGMCAAAARVRSTYFGFSWRDIICALKPALEMWKDCIFERSRAHEAIRFDRNQNGHMFS